MATDDQNVVRVRVQVIDLKSFILDLQVPTYLPARDLTARVARDAGLEAFWPDRRRRLFWMFARGRLLRDEERLSDVGVIHGELVYLLPEPPPDSGVVEQVPEYPETRDYAGAGWLALGGSAVLTLLWALGWGVALAEDRSPAVVTLPGLALGLLCSSLARHAWGGRGDRVRVAATALVLQLSISVIAFLSPFIAWYLPAALHLASASTAAPPSLLAVYRDGAPGIVLGMVGVLMGWLAWWGAVEPLPPAEARQAEEAATVTTLVECGICGLGVEPAVRLECPHACGKIFHKGCHGAKMAVYHGSAARCAVCNKGVV